MNFSPYEHIVECQQFTRQFLSELFSLADKYKDICKSGGELPQILSGRVVALLFYEPSTRTRFSFESAVKRLGGETISTENAREFSSVSKGESIQDTIRTVATYSDLIVIRHNETGATHLAASVSLKPVINAGDGTGQHPTQSLLDLYTILNSIGRLDNLSVAIVGDLKRGRTARSLSYLLSKFTGNRLFFIAPENSRMSADILEHLRESKVEFSESSDLNELLPVVDCVYMTRIQKERFSSLEEYEETKGCFVINSDNIKLMRESAILMHPLPRVYEISPDVDSDARSKYFEQVENGLYIRMALLDLLLRRR